jgi:hypothetical protein
MDPTDLINYQNAIKSIESSGGNYGLTGPVTRNGDRAYGAYQVMGSNIPEWTRKHFGSALTPQQFLQNKEAQDAVFNGQFGSYVQQHGNPQDAASMWFTGRPLAQGGKSSDGYITGNQYVDRFNRALGGPVDAINQQAGIQPQQPQQALGFSGDAASGPTSGTLKFADDGGSGKQDNRYGLGDLFGASDETKAKMHGIGARLVRAAAALSAGVNPGQAAQFNALGKSLEDQNKTDYQYQMGPNGQLIKINKDTGEVSFATLPGGGKGSFGVVMGKDPTTGAPMPIGKINHSTGEFTRYGGQQAQAQQGPQIGGDPSLTGEDRLNSMSPQDQKDVQSIIEGRDPRVLSSMSLRNNPRLNALLESAKAVDPTLDLNKIKNRQVYWADQGKASPSSWGGIMRRSGIGLDQLDKSIDNMGKLGNTSSSFGPTASSLENRMVFGKAATAREAIVRELATNAQNASTDINSLQQGAHGTGAERDSIKGGLNLPNEAPEIQAAAAQAHIDALRSVVQRAKDAEAQNVGTGFIEKDPRWAEYEKKLNAAQDKLDKLKKGDFSYIGGKAPTADAAKPGSIPSSWDEAQKAGWK